MINLYYWTSLWTMHNALVRHYRYDIFLVILHTILILKFGQVARSVRWVILTYLYVIVKIFIVVNLCRLKSKHNFLCHRQVLPHPGPELCLQGHLQEDLHGGGRPEERLLEIFCRKFGGRWRRGSYISSHRLPS